MERSTETDPGVESPHEGQPIETAGAPPAAAEAAVVMLHGRGSTAKHMLRLIDEFLHHGVLYLAPQAAHSSWYPRSADAPLAENEPWVLSALDRMASTFETAADAGVPAERTLLLGFSQGGCLASEFVLRRPRRYGGLVVLSGHLLGGDSERQVEGSVDGTPVFMGCGADDPAVTADHVHEWERVFERLGGDVDSRRYEGLGHAINDDEIRRINTFVERLV